ncbi:DUF1212-domain-containing protein [Hymenopellis radicata]|nr:DUF1212-domain-containing protein [Hymenopellis radicata]
MSNNSDETRPGQKTPRKVQWLDHHNDRELHALDEHALDPTAIDYFTDALVRHQSQSQSQSQSHKVTSASPSPDPTTTRNTAVNAASSTTGPRIHYFPPHPATLPPITTELTSYQRENPPASTTYHPVHHSRNISTATSATTTCDGSPSSSDTAHNVPGTYIDKDENAGLPGPTDSQYREAANLVRAHTRSRARARGFLRGRSRSRSREGESRAKERARDAERDAAPANPRLPQGGGVLGALLTLYNQEQGLPSGATTPVGEDLAEKPWIDLAKQTTQSSATTPPSSKPTSPTREKEPFLLKRSSSMNSYRGRPKNERNGAGTIANLIASTGNITGPAAPLQSQIAPNVKRPGYHLSRYSLESKMPSIKLPSPSLERPKSTHFDKNDMPSLPITPSTDTLATLIDTRGQRIQHEPSPSTFSATSTHKSRWSGVLKDFPYAASVISLGRQTPSHTAPNTPSVEGEDPFIHDLKKDRERRKRRKAEIFITRHVAEIIQRQEFILKLARAMMMFGAPSHRLQAQISATGRVLDVEVSCMYIPDCMLISFDDASTATSSIRFIRQGSALDLGKLGDAYELYWKVIHDDLAVADASKQLTELMKKDKIYPWWALMMIGGMCSSSICTVSFNGSFIDAVAVYPLGALLVGLQLLSVRNELYSNVFEIVVAGLFSFLAAGMAASRKLCYSAIASSSVVLILPGFIILCGSLELMSRNLVSGSVRMFYAVVYALFLGFGLAMGAEAYQKITSREIVGITDYTCAESHDPEGAWWQVTPSTWWAFLTVPMFSAFLSLRNFIPFKRKEFFLLIAIACVGWVTNHFTGPNLGIKAIFRPQWGRLQLGSWRICMDASLTGMLGSPRAGCLRLCRSKRAGRRVRI